MNHTSAHPLVDLYDQAEEAMRGVRTALAAEQWASELLGIVSLAMPREASTAEVDAAVGAFVGELTGLALQAGSPVGLAMLRALAAVARSPGREIADRGARRLAMSGVKDRAWAPAIGIPAVGECYRYADLEGRQESVVATFWYGSVNRTDHLQFHHAASIGSQIVRAQIDVVSEQGFPVLIDIIQQELKQIADGIKHQENRLLNSAIDQKRVASQRRSGISLGVRNQE